MKLAGAIGKSIIPVLAVAASVWFYADLSSVPASGSLLEKLLITKPIVLAIRISLLFVALGVAGFIVVIFWKQISIVKIGSAGIELEFRKWNEFSDKTQEELAARQKEIQERDAKIALLIKEREALLEFIKALFAMDELQEFVKKLIAKRGGES